MAMPQPELKIEQSVRTWQTLQGRLTAAKWLSLSEPEVLGEIRELESDPLFRRLMHGSAGEPPVLRRKRWPASSLHSGFYDINEQAAAASESADIQDLLEDREELLGLIRRIGRQAFETHFLYGEERKPLPDVCAELGLTEEQGRRILDLVLTVGARAEFFRPEPAARAAGLRYHCIADIEQDARDPETFFFRFLSPHWARGRYLVDYERVERWKKDSALAPEERRRLRGLLKKVELLNMRQDTLFQILSRAITEQSGFLKTRSDAHRRPLSLREMARRIGVAPSTVSRAVGSRSVRLPWGEEAPLKSLLSGQRSVLVSILSEWRDAGQIRGNVTDEALMHRLAREHGITVSRRTVNEVRRRIG